ncbi:unnamed protein product [Ectocarpus sp. 13 AM-2016]
MWTGCEVLQAIARNGGLVHFSKIRCQRPASATGFAFGAPSCRPVCARRVFSTAKRAKRGRRESGGTTFNTSAAAAVEAAAAAAPPTQAQLRTLFMHSAVPMVGFGIMDNFVMISAGDLIDNTLGVKFGLATLTAAACGQVVSDVCGVCFGGTVEAFATKMGLPTPDLTLRQRGLRACKLAATSGAASGVVVGCILGMGTLLFMDTTHAEREKKQREMDTLFATILDDGHNIVGAAKCSLFFVDEEEGELWTKVATDNDGEIKTGKLITIPITTGIVGEVVRTKRLLNVADTSKNTNYYQGVDLAMKTTTRNMLAVPVMSRSDEKDDGKVIAVIEMMNKPEGFDENDEKLVGMLAAHVGAFMGQVSEGRAGRHEYGEAVPLRRLPTPKN